MACVGQHISLGLGIPYQVLPQNLSLTESLHSIEFARVLVSHKIDISKTTTAQLFEWEEMLLSIG
jgi:hypothetical protein